MNTVLDLWIQKTGDKGEIPEDPAIAEYWNQQMIEAYKDAYPVVRAREEPW